MTSNFSIPSATCEVPECENKATTSIVLKEQSNKIYIGHRNGFQHIPVCDKHKKEFEKGRMFPFFNRLRNFDRDMNTRIFKHF